GCSWDIHLGEIFGSRLIILQSYGNLNMEYMSKTFENKQVSFVMIVPTLMVTLCEYLDDNNYFERIKSVRSFCLLAVVSPTYVTKTFKNVVSKNVARARSGSWDIGSWIGSASLKEKKVCSRLGSSLIELARERESTSGLGSSPTSGEPLKSKIVSKLSVHIPSALIYNLYGPTECCIASSFHLINDQDLNTQQIIPIGRPLPNYEFYVLDEYLQFVSIGQIGEIYIGSNSAHAQQQLDQYRQIWT
ncbi:unnamed protein product, partial [Didymodactylos carnosus]